MTSIQHPVLGRVEVSARRGSTRISVRWRRGVPYCIVPVGTPESVVRDALDRLAPRVMARKPVKLFSVGEDIVLPGITFSLRGQSHAPSRLLVTMRGDVAYIEVGSAIEIDSDATQRLISAAMRRIARVNADRLLLPRAAMLAKMVGAVPASWHIMDGARTLGKCMASRAIHISYMCVFLPQHLRDYIVMHELAHLAEMNHGPKFHALCDRYCGGHERQLAAELRTYRWPVLR